MLFCSYVFVLLFLPITVAGYFLLNKISRTAGRVWLFGASLYFYGYFNIYYLLLLAFSLVLNYSIGSLIYSYRKKFLLILGIVLNILILGYFKYYDFFIDTINSVFGTSWALKHILLPLGISFFTFQQISYLSDVYHDVLKERYSPLTYGLFVTFFPQLVAGPIVLANEMMPQFADEKNLRVNFSNLSCGIFIFSLGLAKKMLLADAFAPFGDSLFVLENPCFWDSFVGLLATHFQVYFDFSGYCDMAVGIGLMFNINLPVNFISPYRAANIKEFWDTWHITLGRFLSQFIYFPLGGSKKGKFRTYFNLMMVFFVSGVWHGAYWMMVLWGVIHGLAVVVHRIWSKELKLKMPRPLGVVVTFTFLFMILAFFKSSTWEQVKRAYLGFINFDPVRISEFSRKFEFDTFLLFAAGFIIVFFFKPASSFRENFKPAVWTLAVPVVLIICCIYTFNKISPFIYFNF